SVLYRAECVIASVPLPVSFASSHLTPAVAPALLPSRSSRRPSAPSQGRPPPRQSDQYRYPSHSGTVLRQASSPRPLTRLRLRALGQHLALPAPRVLPHLPLKLLQDPPLQWSIRL